MGLSRLIAAWKARRLIRDLDAKDFAVQMKAQRALAGLGEPAVAPLIRALADAKLWYRAYETLAAMGNVAVPPLIAALQHENEQTRSEAARALGRLRSVDAVPRLIEALGDPDVEVRDAAAGALGSIGDGRAVEPLAALLADEDPYVRSVTAQALARFRDPRAREALAALVAHEDSEVREGTAFALAGFGDPRAARPLIALLAGPSDSEREQVVNTIKKLGEPAVLPLIDALRLQENAIVAGRIVNILGALRDPRAVDPLIEALQHADGLVVRDAIRALGFIGQPRAVDPLLGVLERGHETLRWVAAEALGRIGDRRAVPALTAALKDQSQVLMIAAAAALRRMECEPEELPVRVGMSKHILTEVLGPCGDITTGDDFLAMTRAAFGSSAAIERFSRRELWVYERPHATYELEIVDDKVDRVHVRPKTATAAALFVFDSGAISTAVGHSDYGRHAQRELVSSIATVSGVGLPSIDARHGDLFDTTFLGDRPREALVKWLTTGEHRAAEASDDAALVEVLSSRDQLSFIPYIIALDCLSGSVATAAGAHLRSRNAIGYRGVLVFGSSLSLREVENALSLPKLTLALPVEPEAGASPAV